MRRLVLACILGFGLSAATAVPVSAANDGVAAFYAGHASLEKGDAAGSIAHFTEALEAKNLDETQRAYVYHYRAVAYQKIGRQQEAIDDYSKALALGTLPKRVQAAVYYNRAIGLDRQEKYRESIKDFTSAIALKPDYAEAYMNRGNAYRKLGHQERDSKNFHDQALKDYEASSKHGNPMKHLPYFGRGLILEEMGEVGAAYEAFKIAASFAPEDFTFAAQKIADYDAGRSGIRTATSAPAAGAGVTAAIRPNTDAERPVPAATSAPTPTPTPTPTPAATSQTAALDTPKPASDTKPGPQTVPSATESPKAQATTASASASRDTAEVPAEPVSQQKTASPPTPAPVQQTAASTPQQAEAKPKPAEKKPAQSASAGPTGYLVQIASYNSEAGALTEADALRRRNPGVFSAVKEHIVRADLGSRGTYWRLQYGPFGTRGESEAFCRTLKSKGLDCIIAFSKG